MLNPASLILGGQLLGTAFACGLNLYATVAVLGVASRLYWVALPPGMSGLEHGMVIGAAVALYFVGLIVDRVSWLYAMWEAAHTVIRPGAAGLLAVLAFQGTTPLMQAGVASAAVVMALAAHGTKAGVRLILLTRPRPGLLRLAVGLIEDLAAVGIGLAVLLRPHTATAVVGGAVVILLLTGPRFWRAAFLGLHALMARLRGFFRGRGWRSRDQLPRPVRRAVPSTPLGRMPPLAQAASVKGVRGIGAYCNGWLVFTCDGPRFVYRALFRTHVARLPRVDAVHITPGVLTDILLVRTNGTAPAGDFTIYLLKDGPPARVTAAELAHDQP
jgi:hypothetical protein